MGIIDVQGLGQVNIAGDTPTAEEASTILKAAQLKTTTDIPTIAYGSRGVKSEFELTYLKSSVCKQQKRKLERFWFTNGTYLYNIEITQDNPLIEMFRNMIEPGKSVRFTGYYKIERLDQMYFYSLFQFNFSKEQNA